MNLFVAFAALVALAVGKVGKPTSDVQAELEAIVAAINSPHTNPATAALLEQQLHTILAEANPISVGPAIVETLGIVTAPQVVPEPSPVQPQPSPVVLPEPSPVQPASSPLIQIILNVNKPYDVGVSPVVAPTTVSEVAPTKVNFVENAESPAPHPIVISSIILPSVPTVEIERQNN